jgi:non-ribosomal peptide synthetase-like protein
MTAGAGLTVDRAPELHRSGRAAGARTLIDILRGTVRRHPDAVAVDDASTVLTYRDLAREVDRRAAQLRAAGIGRGARVGVHIPAGTADLYVWILAILAAGAAYVPVEFEDPVERAETLFAAAGVGAVVDAAGVTVTAPPAGRAGSATDPQPGNDAWVIFTSGSTGIPKGVAVTHRSAAAFVDAEARLFLQRPGTRRLGPGDRVLAGLSVAFDASCEEMWLAWRHGAALVPVPRAVARSGADLTRVLADRGITVVSTVPTIAGQWDPGALGSVRLLILGGEACPRELEERLCAPGREVWNTYGPTEATVVACAAELGRSRVPREPVRIGLPLDGWDLAVVDDAGQQVAAGGEGELVIGGVGLGRYLDPALDADRFAPLPVLGGTRGYRTGDIVRYDPGGLVFIGRVDSQVKLGGRRVELGEVEAALRSLRGVRDAAAALRHSPAGQPMLVGYLVVDHRFGSVKAAAAEVAERLPAGLAPLLTVLEELPTRSSGKVARDSLPWPLAADVGAADAPASMGETASWVARHWHAVLGTPPTSADDDFFLAGGGSLTAAALVSALRERFPQLTVADLYDTPRLGALVQRLNAMNPAPAARPVAAVAPTPSRTRVLQTLLAVPVATLTGIRWLAAAAVVDAALTAVALPGLLPPIPWWLPLGAVVIFLTPPGAVAVTALLARLLLTGVRAGDHPRGGSVHLRVWLAERIAAAMGVGSVSCAPLAGWYARLLGADVGRDTDLHSLPPVTGLLTLGTGSSVNTEVDLAGHWLDGNVFHLGRVEIGPGASVGSRSVLLPSAVVGAGAEITAGSAVSGRVPAGQRWGGSPAVRLETGDAWPRTRPVRSRGWELAYAAGALCIGLLPLVAGLPAAGVLSRSLAAARAGGGLSPLLIGLPVAAVVGLGTFLLLCGVAIRLLGIGMVPGDHPVRSRVGWQVWSTDRLLDATRAFGYPLYSSVLTPAWLRLLGARIGRGVEASTVTLLPRLTTIGNGAFVADDTMIGCYELRGGWLRIAESKIGKNAFLGNSGMAGPGRRLPKRGLVGVLSAAPATATAGTSWLGSPPALIPRSRAAADTRRTIAPTAGLRLSRALIEICRVVPVVVTIAIALGVVVAFGQLIDRFGIGLALLAAGLPLLAAWLVAALVSIVAKWLLVGRVGRVEHPLWSSFVWRNELADNFVEVVAAAWLPRAAPGAPLLTWWLRGLGARIGRGAWLETYWLPEADLVTIGAGAVVNRGCVLQTHLFHDRVMSTDTVDLDAGATLGPHSIVLPRASLGAHSSVGASSLVLRGDAVPARTRWFGNPIAPSAEPIAAERQDSAAA